MQIKFPTQFFSISNTRDTPWSQPVVTEPQTLGERALFNPLLILVKISRILTKNWKIPVNWPFYHPFCPPMAYFRWILAYIDVLCQLFTFNIQKIDFWVQKWKNFEMLKIFNQAHVWGSSALIMLPHVLGGVCEQRGDPDDDFEYWMAFLPRRGAEIWPDKVFWSKNQKFKKMHFYHLRPSWCIKMVLLGTNSSYVKAYITVGHFWGIWQEKKSFWANK